MSHLELKSHFNKAAFHKHRGHLIIAVCFLVSEYSVAIGLGSEWHPEIYTLLHGLWILTFIPALLIVAFCAKRRKTVSKLAFRAGILWLLFLCVSLLSDKWGDVLLEKNFEQAKSKAERIAGRLYAFHREHKRYPESLDTLPEAYEFPQFALGEFYYPEEGTSFRLELWKPEDSLWNYMILQYHSDSRQWRELSED